MLRLFIFLACLIPNIGLSQDVWIHASGIDRNLHTQNFTYFYEEARDFLRECNESPLKPSCHLYINPDMNLANNPLEVKGLDFSGKKTPTAKLVLEDFRQSLKKAKAGDTIILSLADHGGPTPKGNSCIYLSGNDYLCETDIAKVLKEKPAGVKVYINADGCFSGAFVDIASKDVCITTWADRRAVGTGEAGRLWSRALSSKATILADLKERMDQGFMRAPTMASQSMKNTMCLNIRNAIYFEADKSTNVNDEVSDQLMGPYGCKSLLDSNDLMSIGGLTIQVQQYLNLLTKIQPFTCQQAGLSGEDCAFFMDLHSIDLRTKLLELQSIGKQFDSILWQGGEFYALKEAALKADLADDNLRSCASTITTLNNYSVDNCYRNGKKLSKEDAAKVMAEVAVIQNILTSHKAKQDRLAQEFRDKIRSLFADKYLNATENLEACLFDVEERLDHKTSDPYLPHGAKYPRVFQEQDVKDAVACENSIHFR